MSEHEVELTDEERAQLDASLKASRNNAYGRLQRLSSTVESIVAARLADAEARVGAAKMALTRIVTLLDEEVEPDLDDYEHRAQRVYNIARAALTAAPTTDTERE
jgi:hypothetical protein